MADHQPDVTPEMLAAAWRAWRSRHHGRIGPGPGFREAIEAALAVQARQQTGEAQ